MDRYGYRERQFTHGAVTGYFIMDTLDVLCNVDTFAFSLWYNGLARSSCSDLFILWLPLYYVTLIFCGDSCPFPVSGDDPAPRGRNIGFGAQEWAKVVDQSPPFFSPPKKISLLKAATQAEE